MRARGAQEKLDFRAHCSTRRQASGRERTQHGPTPARDTSMPHRARTPLALSDADSRIPRYVQVASVLRRRIRDGRWAVGERIATLEALEREFGVARVTVRQAIDLLQSEGLVESFQGRGT